MQKGVGTYKVQQRTEISPEPYRHRRYKIGQYLGVGDRDTMLSTFQPNLECVPGFEVWSSFARFFCQCCHDGTGLILCICNSKGEQTSLILWMELDGSGSHD